MRKHVFSLFVQKVFWRKSLFHNAFPILFCAKAARTISKYKMIKNNELVCVAVSGGKDSLQYLLDPLNKMSNPPVT